jgi:hypothetical protein
VARLFILFTKTAGVHDKVMWNVHEA